MFQSLRNYVYERRRGLSTTAGVVGGLYLVGRYVLERLEEMREQVVQNRNARDNLRRRFQQNQLDVSYTIMTHLPILSQRILEEMDVEGVTRELQTKSKASKQRSETPDPASSESSMGSSVELLHGHDAHSDVGSVSGMSFTAPEHSAESSRNTTSSQSWVDEFSAHSGTSRGPSLAMPSEPPSDSGSPPSSGAYLSDSVTTSESVVSASDVERSRVRHVERGDADLAGPSMKNKAELWREVKILTFTRTLTIIYSTTLLSLLTHIQLNLLGRSKYVQSVVELQREEKMQEQREFNASITSLFWGIAGDHQESSLDADTKGFTEIGEATELKFLTLSWWLLHVGWKDVGERVRRSVEEVFEGVSLKTKLGSMELHRLICDVRRRVEHEVTYEGTERKINFLSTLIPPTPETLQHVFVQGGMPASVAGAPDPAFAALLEEMRSLVAGPAFGRVLEVSLDRATDTLFDGMRTNVFADEAAGVGADADADSKIRLAGLLPGLTRWSYLALNGIPNELVDGLADTREMTGFAALIYTSYDDILQ